MVDEALAKFKSSDEFFAFFKKDYDTRFDARVEAIFDNIWTYYRDLDYAFLESELIDFIEEWIKNERLSALDIVPPLVSSDPLTRDLAEIEILLAETCEQPSVVKVDEVTVALDPSIAPEVPVTEPIINLEEEPVATDTEEEAEAAANPFPV